MFDRFQFDKKNENERERQLESLQKRLYEAIAAHNNIREAQISHLPTEEDIISTIDLLDKIAIRWASKNIKDITKYQLIY